MGGSAEQVISAVDHYRRKMERHAHESRTLLHALSKLDRLEGISIAVLHSTGIGKAVNSLKKHEDEDVAGKARAIVAKWKEIVANEEEEQEQEQQKEEEQQQQQEEREQEVETQVEESETPPRASSPPPSAPESPPRSSSNPPEEPERGEPVKKRSRSDRGDVSDESAPAKVKKSSKSKHRDRKDSESSSSHRKDKKSSHASSSSSSSSSHPKKEKDRSSREHRDHHRQHKSDKKSGSTSKESSSGRHRSHESKKSSSRSVQLDSHDAFAAALDVPPVNNGSGVGVGSGHKRREREESRTASPSPAPPTASSRNQSPARPAAASLPVPTNLNPNYKPLPRQDNSYVNGITRKIAHQTEDEALSTLIALRKSKSSRTMVYSGAKRTGYMGEVPSLMQICIRVLQEHVDDIEECGGLGYDILEPVLERASPPTLMHIEERNPNLMEDTGPLWERFCKKHFAKDKREEFESWREMFERCTQEREAKLNMLKLKVKDSYKREESSHKKAKLAYVGTVAKPPRGVMRAQAKHGTGLPVGFKMGAGNVPVRSSVAPVPVGSGPKPKPKVAPMMAKTLRMARGLKTGYRK